MSGIFAEYQPRYAEIGIATFPVKPNKRPAIGRYLDLQMAGSRQLVSRPKMAALDGLGFACGAPSGITVVDVDSTDERHVAYTMDKWGRSPFAVRSGSGHFQVWYKHSGEGRRIRPDKTRPIDILGGGYVVAPPSRGERGTYEIISGSLMDLASLPRMKRKFIPLTASNCNDVADEVAGDGGRVEKGRRNDQTFRHCLLLVRSCASWEEMLCKAALANIERNSPPLPEGELATIAANAWRYQCEGRNFANGGGIAATTAKADFIMFGAGSAAWTLYSYLECRNSGQFWVANGLRRNMPDGGWSREKFTATRSALLKIGALVQHTRAVTGRAALYSFGEWQGAGFLTPILTDPLPPAFPALPNNWQEAA